MRIVAFSGPKYCGKDTAGKGLLDLRVNRTHNVFRHAKMAEGVKNICAEAFGYTEEQLETAKEIKTDTYPFIEPRWAMMDIANWFRDHYSPDVWCQRWERIAHEADDQWACHVMTDLRFPEELAMLQRLDALIIYVWREEAEDALKAKQGAGDAMALNPSEAHYKTIITNASAVIPNDSSIEKLHARVQAAVREKYGFWGDWGAEKSFLEKMRMGELDA